MHYEIILALEAIEDLKKFQAYERSQIRNAIEVHLRHEPEKISKSRIKKLKGLKQSQFRLRINEIRLFYDIVKNRVEVLAIIPKSQAVSWLQEKGKKT